MKDFFSRRGSEKSFIRGMKDLSSGCRSKNPSSGGMKDFSKLMQEKKVFHRGNEGLFKAGAGEKSPSSGE
ncbi:hypothetical protein V1498_19400 [Peribacillus sp. SCS-26]|uniref:hypothetical protein n=1 Tax=Paraperibacillus marinus TaxID=3115295 RepID=UPI003906A3FC